MSGFKKSCLFFQLLMLVSVSAVGQVKMPQIFQNNMVLQRDKPITVWGWAKPGEEVIVKLGSDQKAVRTDGNGKWLVKMNAVPAGGPYTLHISSSNSISFENVLIGDVWICGGQSNMQWKVKQTGFKETDSSLIKSNRIRLFTVLTEMDYQPRTDLKGIGWQELSWNNIEEFSAVAYHFGKKLNKDLDVPIGLVSDNLGATSVETWMSNESLLQFPVFQEEMKETVSTGKSFLQLYADFETYKKKWYHKHYYRGEGVDQKWYLPETDFSDWKPINLAGNTWEQEPDLKDFDGAVWVKTSFDFDKSKHQDSLNIQLLQIDNYDITWVNGVKIGETFGNHNHRNYKVPVSILKPTGNVLVVRIFDTGGIGGFTTSPFWGNSILWGKWFYKKGLSIDPAKFPKPVVPNTTPFSSPSVLFNANIAPLANLVVKGVIWYQGEANADRAEEYGALFPAMIGSWRKNWNDENLPFIFVQLANYMKEKQEPEESAWAELREAQAKTLTLPYTGMVTAIDVGEAADIHPKNKEDVGKRLAVAALKVAYKKQIDGQGPTYSKMSVKGKEVALNFTNITGGIYTTDKYGYVKGFQIAGKEGKFVWAMARITGDQVIVSSDQINEPVAVRYAWSDNPGELNLLNKEGLPAVPFRTDDWKGITDGKKFQSGPRF
ncbi:sialate O-acetylesterase [Dyadobacter sp. CY312]|uniref:sialate O-acetylesterase n=1 Tax=Dyadobacter sp. CY312 TaxID=2907303 RepID=UPI001F19CF7F|nr:sialate O-acetylesterase [Dyadobacter sp. CY312]MCE7043755.1 sialate O-acetylesterase [Dyadobacter sp. CY312]